MNTTDADALIAACEARVAAYPCFECADLRCSECGAELGDDESLRNGTWVKVSQLFCFNELLFCGSCLDDYSTYHQLGTLISVRRAWEWDFKTGTAVRDVDQREDDLRALLALLRQLRKERDAAYATLYMLHGGE